MYYKVNWQILRKISNNCSIDNDNGNSCDVTYYEITVENGNAKKVKVIKDSELSATGIHC